MKIFDRDTFSPPQKDIQMRDESLGRSLGKARASPEGGNRKGGGNQLHFMCTISSACSALLWPSTTHFTPHTHTAPRLGRLPWLMLSSIIKIRYRILSSSSHHHHHHYMYEYPETGPRPLSPKSYGTTQENIIKFHHPIWLPNPIISYVSLNPLHPHATELQTAG